MSIVLICKCSSVAFGQSDIQHCLKGLTHFVNSSPKMYQVVIIYEYSQGVLSVVDEISRVICNHVSTVTVDSYVSIEHPLNQPPSERIGRPRTLFIIFFLQESFAKKTLKKLEKILWTSHDPRLLLISLNYTHEDLLLYAWKKQFINVIHLPVIVSTASKHLQYSSDIFSNFSILQFNPFIDKREASSCHIHTNWFPNKMKNLQGFSLPVGMLNDPPICNLVRNSTGHVVEKSGAEIAMLNFLAHAMNFKINITPWTGANFFGTRDPNDKTKLIGYVEELRQHKFDFIANHRVRRFAMENECTFDFTKSLITDHYCIVVPIIQIDYFATYHILGFIIGIALFIIFRTFARFCYFSGDYWFGLNILSAMLGFSARGMPKNISERVTLMILITSSSLYSVHLGNELISDSLDIKNEVEFRELKDLLKYQLVPMADQDGVPAEGSWEVLDDHGNLRNLSILPWETKDKCLNTLTKHKNVSCWMGKLDAIISLHRYNSYRYTKKSFLTFNC